MGMFDYLQCDHALPDGRVVSGPVWQTKDGPCEMGTILITSDGKLRIEVTHWEDIPEEKRPYYGKPEWSQPFFQIMGSIRRVVDGHTGQAFTGGVTFYRSLPLDDREWEEYTAVFVDGSLVAIREMEVA